MKVWNFTLPLACISGILADNENTTDNDCLIRTEGFCLPNDYNKNQRPQMGLHNNESLNVQVKFRVEQITAVEDKDFKISLLMYLSLYWEEPRLKYILANNKSKKPEDLPLNMEWANKLWTPDVFVYKMESASF